MVKLQEIGGYFSLELPMGKEYWENAIRLNTARNALRYIIRAYHIDILYVPEYTCPVVWDSVSKENCEMMFYSVDDNFFPTTDFEPESYILYTNYFGICSNNVEILSKKYPNLIVDNSQSFFSPKQGLASFNSARKFFGVPDGSYLFIDKEIPDVLEQDMSWQRCSHLLIRLDSNAENGYSIFKNNDDSLDNEPIKIMSKLTQNILKSIDYQEVYKKRRANFLFLQRELSNVNKFKYFLDENSVPMIYPFVLKNNDLRTHLIKNKIYIPCYWEGQKDLLFGKKMEENLIALPIDQRYSESEMVKIVEYLKKETQLI